MTANTFSSLRARRFSGKPSAWTAFGQTRLAVAFHRLIMPDGYSVSLDQFKGMNQIGDTGLRDKVNNHYFKIFGASLAVGAIGGIAEAHSSGLLTQSGTRALSKVWARAWAKPRSASSTIPEYSADRHDPRRPSREDLSLGRPRASRLRKPQDAL